MFQLIISILAIILAIVLAGISVYYGSDAFNSGKEKADATTIINQAAQIEAAMTLYNSQNKGQLDVGGRLSTPEGDGLFAYLLAKDPEGKGKYLKNAPDGNGGTWELRCVDSTNQAAFEGDDNPATCGVEGVALTLNNVEAAQCNLINVLLNYEYKDVLGGNPGRENTLATEDGYVPSCADEPNAPCCDTP
jgi:hypothetical protein